MTADLSAIRAITFDCYGTLIDWETGILGAFARLREAHGFAASDAELLRHYAALEAELESGDYLSYRQVLRGVVRGLGTRLNFEPSDADQRVLEDSLAHWRPFTDTAAGLRRLQSRFRVGVISNIDRDLFAASAAQLGIVLDALVTAADARAYKPDRRNFRMMLETLQLPAGAMLHAAQSRYHDIVPTRELGIANVWVRRGQSTPDSGAVLWGDTAPDYTVDNLLELCELLGC